MQIIISHINTDFDALASMLAAKKIYPNAKVVISDKQNITVKQFLTIYREKLGLVKDSELDWETVTEIIMVDEASLARVSDYTKDINREEIKIIVYDHHPEKKEDVTPDAGKIEMVGAAVTLLIEEIIKDPSITISPFEATLFGLGLYTDTGAFTYNNTTARDLEAASFLMSKGMDLEIINRFSDEMLDSEQQAILNSLFQNIETLYVEGLQIVVSTYQTDKYTKGLATLVEKLSEVTDADATLIVVEMKNRVYLIGRSHSNRVNLLPLLEKWQGGGHEQAGSASIKDGDYKEILQGVKDNLAVMLTPAITARDMMSKPVKTILPETTIDEAGHLMFRYGHSGFPVVKEGELLGLITRRDLEKATHHGLGHAPVKAYMTTQVVSIHPETTEEEIQQLVIDQNIGRIPVIESGKLIGIVSRTNIIEMMHNKTLKENIEKTKQLNLKDNLQADMKAQLPSGIYELLKDISKSAKETQMPVYLIGGIVRDIILKKTNDDIDIVVEGNGITFAQKLYADYGGELILHESFKTATWTHPSNIEIDVTSSRLEFYDRPAALPDVESSTLKEDLFRRDFTINAMAIYLNEDGFGKLIDPFNGQRDLKEKRIKILHNISFIEDPTRILRGIRFETRFNFLMDEQTENLALQSMSSIKNLSANRIVGEMSRLFKEVNPVRSIHRLFELKFFYQYGVERTCEELSTHHATRLQAVYERHIKNQQPEWFDYFLMPFYEANKIQVAKQFALRKRDIQFLQEMLKVEEIDHLQTIDKRSDFHLLLKDYSDSAILFHLAKKSYSNESLIIDYLKRRKNLPPLLTGKDLIEQGLKPSTYFSEILFNLDLAILNDEISTKDEALEWLKKQIEK